jgi:hypothetical protein
MLLEEREQRLPLTHLQSGQLVGRFLIRPLYPRPLGLLHFHHQRRPLDLLHFHHFHHRRHLSDQVPWGGGFNLAMSAHLMSV